MSQSMLDMFDALQNGSESRQAKNLIEDAALNMREYGLCCHGIQTGIPFKQQGLL